MSNAAPPPDPAALRALSRLFPTLDAALAELARLSAELTYHKGTVHVISDIHGEHAKLRHVINNASGALRPLVEDLFRDELSPDQLRQFLTLLFYPAETLASLQWENTEEQQTFCRRALRQVFRLIQVLARNYSFARAVSRFPEEYRVLFQELFFRPEDDGQGTRAIADALAGQGQVFRMLRLAVRVARNLTIDEIVIGGDCWDRGPRGDRVVDYLMMQPRLSFVWGNHDAAWLGACLGHEALIASVLRVSLRYRRLSQLEEGYGITLQPLERLARTVYGEDEAKCYQPRGSGLRETVQIARMQKAAAVMQFKLEGQVIGRNPHFEMEHRRLLHHLNLKTGTIEIDGVSYPLRDTHFPTIDPADPYALSPEERVCMDRLRQSFLSSRKLWDHICFLVQRGAMYLRRDDHLIFHGCVPVDEAGEFLPFAIDGQERRGRALFEAIEQVIARVPAQPVERDLDLLWYLWCGPRSPLFGKDRITTLENDLVEEHAKHVETKNPYFQLIHEAPFCERVLREFGVDPERGLIVNGHVPVKVEKGESPLKRSGKAITIDGAFSQAYGDHGYTLVLEPDRTVLAQHHHFESVEAAVREGVDIIPEISVIRRWERPRQVADTEQGEELRREIALLGQLCLAYRENRIKVV